MGWESSIERKGSFPVNSRKFEENNDLTAAEVAYQWIRQIMLKENISKLILVAYNGDHDITDLVKQKNIWQL